VSSSATGRFRTGTLAGWPTPHVREPTVVPMVGAAAASRRRLTVARRPRHLCPDDRTTTQSGDSTNCWLEHLADLLARAANARAPAIERARLLGAFSARLDDFFMTGVATPARHDVLHVLCAEYDRMLHDDVLPALDGEGVTFPAWDELTGDERERLSVLFADLIYPLVTPLVVDPTHPFPYIPPLSLNMGVMVRDRRSKVEKFACVVIPSRLSRFGRCQAGFVRLGVGRLVCLDTLVRALVGELFHGVDVAEKSSFRVIRNDGIGVADHDRRANLRQFISTGRPVSPARLEVEDATSARMLDIIVRNLSVVDEAVYRARTPLGLAMAMSAGCDDESNR
jgi:polyphosphate kinase